MAGFTASNWVGVAAPAGTPRAILEKANADISGKEPEFFIKTGDVVVGHGQPVVLDRVLTSKLDGEVELAAVIGKSGRHIAVEDALSHVFGYTIVNDMTARDRQVRKRPDGSYWYELGRGKFFDGGAPMGPCITTADDIPDPHVYANALVEATGAVNAAFGAATVPAAGSKISTDCSTAPSVVEPPAMSTLTQAPGWPRRAGGRARGRRGAASSGRRSPRWR